MFSSFSKSFQIQKLELKFGMTKKEKDKIRKQENREKDRSMDRTCFLCKEKMSSMETLVSNQNVQFWNELLLDTFLLQRAHLKGNKHNVTNEALASDPLKSFLRIWYWE